MHEIIRNAIADQMVLTFFYQGARRVVEPHAFGRQANGRDALRAWQKSGGSGVDFRIYLLEDISGMSPSGGQFDRPRPGYRRGDSRFVVTYAEL